MALFKKGMTPWNKGKSGIFHSSEETKKKISLSLIGKNTWSKGKKMSDEAKKHLSMINTGRSPYKMTNEIKEKIRTSHKGLLAGEKHPRWIKDRTQLKKYQGSEEKRGQLYKHWRKQVWLRDSFKCRMANQDCNGRIEVHHILGWTKYPELRYEINNGITLCNAHHPRKKQDELRLLPHFQQLVSGGN